MTMDMIIIMFGVGNVVHWGVSLLEEKVFLRRELKKAEQQQEEVTITK